MTDVSYLEAEERALVTLARQTMVVYALTHSERSFKLAHDALQRAELLRREAYLRRTLESADDVGRGARPARSNNPDELVQVLP